MSGSVDGEVQPNLVPMLDMVFQLITFFMLVMNFKAAAFDLSLKLPVVGSARPVETGGLSELLILNIDSKGDIKVYGQPRNVESYVAGEAQASRLAAKRKGGWQEGDDLPTVVVIRADRSTPFRLLNRVIRSCQDNGFRRFALKALNR